MPKAVATCQTSPPPESRSAPSRESAEQLHLLNHTVETPTPEFGQSCERTHHWTPELESALKTAWSRGGARAARRAMRREVPSWSWSSIRKHASKLGLCRPKAKPWSQSEIDHLLWSIDSNASLSLIAKRLGRTVAAIRKRLWDMGYRAESFGGYKVKELAEMLGVPPSRVQYWVEEHLLFTKGGRITESSLTKFLADSPERIPFRALNDGMRNWLYEMGYPKREAADAVRDNEL